MFWTYTAFDDTNQVIFQARVTATSHVTAFAEGLGAYADAIGSRRVPDRRVRERIEPEDKSLVEW